MADIIKTWPGFMEPRKVLQIFSGTHPAFDTYWFTVGRGRPKTDPENIWFTYRGRILGSMRVLAAVRNDGSLPRLRRLDGGESDWQIRPMNWVLMCRPPMRRLRQYLYFPGFRGWRYFDLEAYRASPDAHMNF